MSNKSRKWSNRVQTNTTDVVDKTKPIHLKQYVDNKKKDVLFFYIYLP